ncbi:MAG: hypothetical protein RAP70_05300 [Candidatus Celaenobacter antarcticus]|nr:hypothetical protein [Candidatus Celaenobacter antarcticus]
MTQRINRFSFVFVLLFCAIIFLFLTSCDLTLTDPDLTDAPSNLKIKKTDEGRIEITWTYQIPDHADSDTLYFVIGKKVGTSNWNDNYQNISTQFFTYLDNIPTNDSLVYAYKIKFYNKSTDESSPYSEVIAFMSAYCDPSDLMVEQKTQAQIEVSWQDHCVGEEGYYIDKKVGVGNWKSKYRTLNANATSFTDDVNLFEEVFYRVTAFVGTTTSSSTENSIVPTLLSPSNLALQKLDQNKIKLTWQDNSEGEVGFHIDKKIGGNDWVTNYATVDSNIITFIDDITEPCGTFYYRLNAYSGTYTSANSNEEHINILLDEIGFVNTPGVAQDIITSGWYAFVPDNYEGLQIINFGNPESPEIIYTMDDFEDRVISADIKDDFLYVTSHCGIAGPGVISMVDISDPNNPVLTSNSFTSGIPYDIQVVGDFAYVADGDNGLTVFFISGSAPHFVTNVSTGGHAQSIYIDGTNAYITQGLDGIAIFDITDPFNPTLSSTYATSGAKDIFVQNNYAFIADSEDGLLILDVFNPSSPAYTARLETDGFATGVYANNTYAYISDSEVGLITIDISSIIDPFILGYYSMTTEPSSLTHFCSYALLIDNEGMKIVQVGP